MTTTNPARRRFASRPSRGARLLLATLCLLSVGFVGRRAGSECLAREQPPNVLVILADDQGWGDLSSHGNPNLATPHIDKLAASGARFERFYVQPVCAPTRAEMLTGRYAPRDGVTGVTRGAERLDPNVPTIADAFQKSGYATAAFGKWHNGTQAPYHPNSRGFGEFYGFCSGHWGLYFNPVLEHNHAIVRGEGYLADDLTNHAIDFIKQHQAEPFFTLVAYNTPHSPMQVPDRWWEPFAGKALSARGSLPQREQLDHTRAALAMCENLDWNVGRLLAALEQLQLTEETIVVYFSDNGPNGHRWNGQMRGIKGSTDEGGVRVPLIVRWPGSIQPETLDVPAAAIDLAPTLADLAGVAWKPQLPADGVSLKRLLLGEQSELPLRTLFTHWGSKTAARREGYLLDDQSRLYHLPTDPEQTTDLSKQQPERAAQLKLAVANWLREVQPTPSPPPRPYTVGHPDSPLTQLPARDAQAHGRIKRSSKHANCSFFTNWSEPTDKITWDVEVAQAGRYRAVVYYTCSEANLGSLVELRLGEHSTQARVATAHDPAVISEQYNRFPAEESPVKDFAPLDLGVIELPATTGRLTLSAKEIPAQSVMDFRLLVLTRE